MGKTVDFRLLILATLFGFLGGALSSIALPQLAFAQSEPSDKIVAHEFHVIDDEGKVVGVFGAAPGSLPQVIIRDGNGVYQGAPRAGPVKDHVVRLKRQHRLVRAKGSRSSTDFRDESLSVVQTFRTSANWNLKATGLRHRCDVAAPQKTLGNTELGPSRRADATASV